MTITVTKKPLARPAPVAVTVILGMDLGDRRSDICVLELASGEVIERFTLDTTPSEIEVRLSESRGATIVVEAGKDAVGAWTAGVGAVGSLLDRSRLRAET